MANTPSVTASNIEAAVKAAKANGLTVGEIILRPKEVRIQIGVVEQKLSVTDKPKPKQW